MFFAGSKMTIRWNSFTQIRSFMFDSRLLTCDKNSKILHLRESFIIHVWQGPKYASDMVSKGQQTNWFFMSQGTSISWMAWILLVFYFTIARDRVRRKFSWYLRDT